MNRLKTTKLLLIIIAISMLLSSVVYADPGEVETVKYVYFKDSNEDIVFVDFIKAMNDVMVGDNTLYSAIKVHVGEAELNSRMIVVETSSSIVLDYKKALYDSKSNLVDIKDDPTYYTTKPDYTHELKVVDGEAVIVPISVVDKTALEAAIAAAETKVEELYTAESWATFAAALADAQAVAVDPDATQNEVDNALAALNTAMDELEPKPDDPILGDIADQMQEVYAFLGELVIDDETGEVSLGDQDKQDIRDAREAILYVTPEEWETVLGIGTGNNLLTQEVISRFGTEEEAKQAIIDFVTGFSEIYYSTDRDELIDIMRNFRDAYTPTFKTLFGDDVTMSDLYDLVYQAKLELPDIASENKVELKGLLQAPDGDLIDAMYEYGKDAMRRALFGHNLSGKLSEIGWSMDLVLDRQQALSEIIDPSRNIELALGKAYIRSQTELIPDVSDLEVDQEQAYAISVFGIGEEEGLASLVDWYSTNSEVVEAELAYLTAKAPGTTTIIVYRAGDMADQNDTTPENDWIYYFEITVVE